MITLGNYAQNLKPYFLSKRNLRTVHPRLDLNVGDLRSTRGGDAMRSPTPSEDDDLVGFDDECIWFPSICMSKNCAQDVMSRATQQWLGHASLSYRWLF